MSVLARVTPSVMPTGSPSPPYKDTPFSEYIGEYLLTKSIPIGGIKRKVNFCDLGYKKNAL